MPWEQPALGRRSTGPTKERRCIQIMCATEDCERLAKLVMAAKERGIWTREFGVCYPTEAPDKNYSDDERDRYAEMVEIHGSAQLSMGSAPVYGLDLG